ncbi:ankyrin repeat domain-containing protein 26 isoform X1 [Esox lucius]|uniref:ankyrin repeat domain-containing protein 26 isoform X1 n=1 Tax=Esox lucius TaxID=8010 RepID=UPI001476966B|nr:ankyrin repeat domain-containing protein 26 isoform X1 [Esox lucius]XP_034143927.1 ankyrin repeat domain-containing protein 26 isoform X1 [Esox lucius]
MKKIFNFTKKKKGFSPNTSDTGSVLSVGYDLKEKDLGKVHKAAYGGDLAKLKQLAKKNDINQLDKENRTALHFACANGQTDVVQFLVEIKAKLNLCDNQNRSPLMKAVQCQQERCVATLLEHDADPNLVDINGNTALHLASCIPAVSTAILLLEHEANVNAQNKEGYSPLTMAVKENHAEMAEFLLKEGADVNIKDRGHRSPLMIAACNGQISMVRLLLQYDADITLKDNNGWSSDDYAVMNGHHACSHLIIEHGTKRMSIPSLTHYPTKKNQTSMLGSSSQETGFSLGGPATDKEEQGASQAGRDVEDNSQTESMSRASKSVADDSWPSTDEDDKLDIGPKRPPKLNLKKLMNASKTKKNYAVPDLNESECESEDSVQRNPSLPKAFPPRSSPQYPVSPLPTFNSNPLPMTSTPLRSCKKEKYSSADDDYEDYEEDEGVDEEDKRYHEELDKKKTKQPTEEQKDNPFVDVSLVAGSEDASKEKQRDFLSELGLEKEDDEEDSWDTESGSGSPRKQHVRVLANAPHVSIISEENKEVVRNEDEAAGSSKVPEKHPEKVKMEMLSIFSKLELAKEDNEKKTDIMEDLGVGDVDDFEEAKRKPAEASDWDVASTASRRTLSGCRASSPGCLEVKAVVQEQEADPPHLDTVDIADRSSPEETRPSPSDSPLARPGSLFPHTQLQPQHCAKETLLQTAESEKDSDWDSDHVTTSSLVKPENQQLNITENSAVLKPDNHLCEPSPIKQKSESSPEPEMQLQEEKDDVLDPAEVDISNPYHLGPVRSQTWQEEKEEQGRSRDREDGASNESEKEPGWEKCYEKIWMEMEKRDVMSTYKNVAAELKEMFGELPAESTCEEITDEEFLAPTRTAEKEFSDEDGMGEPIRPLARVRRSSSTIVLLTIPEQSESGLDDCSTESTDNYHCENKSQRFDTPGSSHLSPRVDDHEMTNQQCSCGKKPENRFPLPQLSGGISGEQGNFDLDYVSKTFTDDNVASVELKSDSSWNKVKTNAIPDKDTTTGVQTSPEGARPRLIQEGIDDEQSPSMSEEEPEMLPYQSQPTSVSIVLPRAPSHPSDEELEEYLQGFKHKVDEGKTKIKVAVLQNSSALQDAGGPKNKQSKKNAEEKPETTLEHPEESLSVHGALESEHQLRLTDSISQRHWSKSQKSTNRAVDDRLQQQKMLGRALATEATLQIPCLGEGKQGQVPQATNHVNGRDSISVFDDSTLSDVSDNDGRPLSEVHHKDKPPNAGDMDMAEEFDELTQSSDTATSDLEDLSSAYRHTSSIIKQLDFATLDSVSMVKLQNMFHEYERTIQRERDRQGRLVDKMCQLEAQQVELRDSLEESRDSKQALDHRQLELDTDLNNLKFQLKQEQEKHRNASMLYEKTRVLLRKKEEDLRTEAEGKHKVELALRNLELEKRAILNNMKQLEEDRSETQKLLNQERGARALSETLLNNNLRKQQEIEEENRRTICKSNEALSQLTEATDRERELLQQNSALQDDLSSLRVELERSRSHSRQEESRLTEECEALREHLEDARRDLKLNEEALAQMVYQYTGQLTTLKAELSVTSTRLEHERQAREQLEAEGESGRTRLTGALQEAERCQAARADAERALQREREERQRAQDKLTGETANKREAVGGLSQKLAKAESRTNSLENEVHRLTMALTETEHMVTALQREKEVAMGRLRELEAALQVEREQAVRACARQEALQERLAVTQSEGMLIRQHLEEAQNKGMAKEKAVTDAQERFGDLLAKLRADGEEHVQLVEERSRELATKAAELRDQVYKLEEEKNERETVLRQLQQELADSLKKLSMSEASLEVNTRYRNDLEEEKARLLKDMDRLKGKLEESEDQHVQAERRINALKSILNEKDHEVVTASRKLQEVLLASAGSDSIRKQLEEAVQRLEIENARLEAAAKHQTNNIEALQKDVQDAAIVRNRLENFVTGLQSSKMTLEEQLSQEVQKQSMLSHNAQDSHTLWEEQLKSRSKLGLRLAELEKEKADLFEQMELEKKKVKKIAEQKKSVDNRLDQEMKRNTELQKEMYRLRTLVKTAKKKLREQDGPGFELGSPISSMRGEMGHRQTEAAISRMKDKVDDLSVQLQKEASRCSQLERVNKELKEQLVSFKNLGRSNERLERSKKHLEEELLGLRQQVELGVIDQSQVDHYRREAEERARQEIRQKLEEVNIFLQTQAASQEALDQIKAASEASLRSTLEQRIRELEGELGRARSTQQDSMNLRDSTHTELERYRELYMEELRLRKSLAAKLERSNERLAEANAKLLNERHRSKSLIASSIVNGSLGGPSHLEMGSLGSVSAYGATLGPPNRNIGGPIKSLGDGVQSSRVETYLAKVQNELERNISKELDHATAELEGSARVPPVGSASGSPISLGMGLSVAQDPVIRATQQYLEVLKKNYMI